MADVTLDARGLRCPLPILKAKKAILEVAVGGTLEVLATDPGSREDFHVFSETTGHPLVAEREENGVFAFVLRRTR
jgi:tRNA 2-thiouridine synthesizing protein A